MYPLGATWDGDGTNFAVYSEPADYVELCLFDPSGRETRHRLPEVTAYVHHGYLPGVGPGQNYGFRVHGPWNPSDGWLCNPYKLLVDPYAKSVAGQIRWGREVYGHRASRPTIMSTTDSAPFMPKSVVIDPSYDWEGDERPNTPLHRSIIYEAHVKGMTYQHPEVPPELRGTYAGMVHPAMLEYLVNLGITAIELLPVHQFLSEHTVVERGLVNYWGYNTLAFLAPHGAYSASGDSGGQVNEFKDMVKAFHRAGIEVILDVVYNHTAEGNHEGALLSLKGFDNPAYYRLNPEDRSRYIDFSGTGNSLDMRHSQPLQLMMDSLRYWISEMRVDGFRFDLAAALARGLHAVDRLSSFFDLIHQDPVINQVKLIAEPWDVGEGGYQVGNFPPLWSEWNGKYRDGVRDYWRSADETLADFASRFTGSSDLYEWSGRRPSASVNFITAHDGFTLADLVAYNEKHNEANNEDNRDGDSHNRSWNSGAEGPTDDPDVRRARSTRQRSMLATLLLSQGIPMLLAGDELGRSQGGNNNAYCQDSPVSWIDWNNVDADLLEFTRLLIQIRTDHPTFRRRRWFEGRSLRGSGSDALVRDIGWYTPDGIEMNDHDWDVGYARSLAVYLNGEAIASLGPRGERVVDASFLLLFNARPEYTTFKLPNQLESRSWTMVFDTANLQASQGAPETSSWDASPWAMLLLQGPTSQPVAAT